MTNEARMQMAKNLVEKRLREMLGLSETVERTRSQETRHDPTEETGLGRTPRVDENQKENLTTEDTEEQTSENDSS
jgi:hypothetical protein